MSKNWNRLTITLLIRNRKVWRTASVVFTSWGSWLLQFLNNIRRNRLSIFNFFGVLVQRLELFHISSQNPNFVIFVFLKIKPKFSSKTKLQQIIVQRLFWNSYFVSCFFKSDFYHFSLWSRNSVIQFSSFADFFNNIADFSFFGSSWWFVTGDGLFFLFDFSSGSTSKSHNSSKLIPYSAFAHKYQGVVGHFKSWNRNWKRKRVVAAINFEPCCRRIIPYHCTF